MEIKSCWMMGVNLNGLWDNKPKKGIWNKHLNCWYDKSGNFNVNKIGLEIEDCIVRFASYNEKDIEIFILGARSLSNLIQNIIWTEKIFPRPPKKGDIK